MFYFSQNISQGKTKIFGMPMPMSMPTPKLMPMLRFPNGRGIWFTTYFLTPRR